MALASAAWQPVPILSSPPGQLQSRMEKEGKRSARTLHGWGPPDFQALHLGAGQGKVGSALHPSPSSSQRRGWRWGWGMWALDAQCGHGSALPQQSLRGSPGQAGQYQAGSLSLWVGRAMGRVRGREGQRSKLKSWGLKRAGPRLFCWKLLTLRQARTLPQLYWEVLLGHTAALTFRENISFGTFLPEGATHGG